MSSFGTLRGSYWDGPPRYSPWSSRRLVLRPCQASALVKLDHEYRRAKLPRRARSAQALISPMRSPRWTPPGARFISCTKIVLAKFKLKDRAGAALRDPKRAHAATACATSLRVPIHKAVPHRRSWSTPARSMSAQKTSAGSWLRTTIAALHDASGVRPKVPEFESVRRPCSTRFRFGVYHHANERRGHRGPNENPKAPGRTDSSWW